VNALDQFDSERPPSSPATPPAHTAGGEAYLSGDLLNAFLGTTEYASRRIYRVTTSGAELIPFTVTRTRKTFRPMVIRIGEGLLVALVLAGAVIVFSLWR
jgi:hypothetical protein